MVLFQIASKLGLGLDHNMGWTFQTFLNLSSAENPPKICILKIKIFNLISITRALHLIYFFPILINYLFDV